MRSVPETRQPVTDEPALDFIFQGTLFSNDFLTQSITRLSDWKGLDDASIDALAEDLKRIFQDFPTDQKPNESRTEDDLIWPILRRLGWVEAMRQQNLTVKGREDVPDGILFADRETRTRADTFREEWKRYEFGLAIVEAKRWNRPLDRRAERRGEELAPSTQMLRYLRRVDDITAGKLRWGVLTNGGRWRLYWAGARSVSEQFFDIDLATVLGIGSQGDLLGPRDDADQRHALRLFALIFRREAFLPASADGRTFHQRAIEEGRFYEERVATDLSNLVFNQLYPSLARSIAEAQPAADLEEVRQAALILLYRLLFILYAEDRDLLPVKDRRYDEYGLRMRVRLDVGRRIDEGDTFSTTAGRYWGQLDDLCRAIDRGDPSIGLPPYNGGLFDAARTPLLARIRLSDAVMADAIDKLSFERKAGDEKRYINYRDLSVQQLGSIYERLLEHEVVRDGSLVDIRPNIFARKGSGSYYTPDSLVSLIIRETIDPLIADRLKLFRDKAADLTSDDQDSLRRLTALKKVDPAEAILSLKICDPAMGSGHFLVSLVDYLTDQVIEAMATAEAAVDWADEERSYVSPIVERIETIRETIIGNAEAKHWTVDPKQLDDRHIVRRMVLKRCVYGVDKNPMAVELAKVALWLHSFTVGAPLSFLDHHLRCGDSLFGLWVDKGIEKATTHGGPLLLYQPIKDAYGSASSMHLIESLPDAEIAEAHRSQDIFTSIQAMTAPLNAFLSLLHALDWLDLKGKDNLKAVRAFFDGSFGNPFDIATGRAKLKATDQHGQRFKEIFAEAQALIAEERFMHWQVMFPGVWSDWDNAERNGGFDAIIGNPPWDKMKLQQVEWFAARRREIALAQKASDREMMVAALEKAKDPLAQDYAKASARAEAGTRMARNVGEYPLLSGGDVNLYSLFVERAMALVKPNGMVGLLTPSGIASDLNAAKFFKGVATEGRLKAFYDFENRRTRYNAQPFFPDVDSRFKFSAMIASPNLTFAAAECAFFLQDVSELADPERRFPLTAADFARVNPNTGTAPIFRSRRDAALTTKIYANGQVLVDRSSGREVKAWPVKYATMFHMTNDSGKFRTRQELEEKEAAWPIGGNRWQSGAGVWLPLYEGKMVQAYDHRAASVVINPENQHRPAQPEPATLEQKSDPAWLPTPQFWVSAQACGWKSETSWVLGFKEITAPTNVRTFIAVLFPSVGFGNKVPILVPEQSERTEWLLAANFNSTLFDFATRQKVQGQTLNLFIVEQLPVIPPDRYDVVHFGKKAASTIIREAVLELTYTAHDMAPFARDLGYVDEAGQVKPPFAWDEERRLKLRAKLDAVFFHLYGITDRDDVRYIYSTFPIVERQEAEAYGGRYRSRDLCLAYMSALAAGQPDAEVSG
jgi:hypothetical protein